MNEDEELKKKIVMEFEDLIPANISKKELDLLRTRITEQDARIETLEKLKQLAVKWREQWFDEGDLRELESGCKCEKCLFVTELDWLIQKESEGRNEILLAR